MRIEVLKKGDVVINVWENRIAIKRKNGETDILCFEEKDGNVRIIPKKTVTRGFGSGVVVEEVDGVTITTF